MIDPKILRERLSEVEELLQERGLPEKFSAWPKLDQERRQALGEVEQIRAEKNRLGPEIAKAKKAGEDASQHIADLKKQGEREKELNERLSQISSELEHIELRIPNLPHESVPPGTDESANRLEKEWGEKPKFDFKPKAHWDVGENLGVLDFETAATLSGARFALYRGAGAKLERALASFMLDKHTASGYEEIIPPYLVRPETMESSGQLPKFEAEAFRTNSTDTPLYLIPTSEVPLVNLHKDKILDVHSLPLNYVSFTPCFRAEAGSYGKDVRGLIRLHQFQKVELVKFCTQERSYEEHEKLTRDAEGILEALELPYRRLTLCRGDMGMVAAKTYDLEVWLPGLNCYREISSCSNTESFQSRRAKIRYRDSGKPLLAHILNGSGLAVGRTVVAVLENYQQKDGSVLIPQALRPYMGGLEVIEPA